MRIKWIGVGIFKRMSDAAGLPPSARAGRGRSPFERRDAAPLLAPVEADRGRPTRDEAAASLHPTDDEAHHQQN